MSRRLSAGERDRERGGPGMSGTTPKPHFRALDHVGYAVADLDRSIAFYAALLGTPLKARKTWDVPYVGDIVGYPGVILEGGFFDLPNGVVLELLEYKNHGPGVVDMESYNAGNAHLCLVTDDMEADFARMRAAGYDTFRSQEPVVIPWGPYKGGIACFLRDPDGNFMELFQVPPGGPAFDG
jgi:catechol 2,3-dioxygenase-like lactoylglutathione lyase family enzyme